MKNVNNRQESEGQELINSQLDMDYEPNIIQQNFLGQKRRKSSIKKDQPVNENRRIAQASRTLKACELCRKQKTRCFRSSDNVQSCLRCKFLKKICSFEIGTNSELISLNEGELANSNKIDLIYNGVNEILNLLKKPQLSTSIINNDNDSGNASTPTNVLNDGIFQTPSESFMISPFSLLDKTTSRIPKSISNIINENIDLNNDLDDIISNGILSRDQVVDLMNNFTSNYGRWVLFPSSLSTTMLIDRIRSKSSLLLTSCCCISARYALNSNIDDNYEFDRTKKTIKALQRQLSKDLDKSIKISTTSLNGQIEYLQALVILSIYLYSLTTVFKSVDEEESFTIDPWLLSSMGLTTFIGKAAFGNLFKNPGETSSPLSILYDELDSREYQALTNLRIYNHLCLVHLVNCIFSGRMCIIDEIRLNYCSSTLNLSSSTNFDGRMVSEIEILLITYNYIQINLNFENDLNSKSIEKAFENVLREVDSWHQQWEFIFNQPAIQFVEFCYDFCTLMIYFTYNYHKSIRNHSGEYFKLFDQTKISIVLMNADDNSLIKMIHHGYSVVKTAKQIESDSYFAYLSDQVHFMFFFAGILLIYLMKFINSNSKLSVLNNIDNNDILIDPKVINTDLQTLINKLITVSQGFKRDLLYNYSEILIKIQEDE